MNTIMMSVRIWKYWILFAIFLGIAMSKNTEYELKIHRNARNMNIEYELIFYNFDEKEFWIWVAIIVTKVISKNSKTELQNFLKIWWEKHFVWIWIATFLRNAMSKNFEKEKSFSNSWKEQKFSIWFAIFLRIATCKNSEYQLHFF